MPMKKFCADKSMSLIQCLAWIEATIHRVCQAFWFESPFFIKFKRNRLLFDSPVAGLITTFMIFQDKSGRNAATDVVDAMNTGIHFKINGLLQYKPVITGKMVVVRLIQNNGFDSLAVILGMGATLLFVSNQPSGLIAAVQNLGQIPIWRWTLGEAAVKQSRNSSEFEFQ